MYVEYAAFPVKTARMEDYQRAAQGMAELFVAHGALGSHEMIGHTAGSGLAEAVAVGDDETLVLSTVEWPDAETAARGKQRVVDDPRMVQVMNRMMGDGPVMDHSRTLNGGFTPLVRVTA